MATSRERAEAVKTAVDLAWRGEKHVDRDGLTLVFDRPPEFAYNKRGEIVGVDAMVRLFDAASNEVKIDPHRRIINPPTVPRANLTYEEGETDEAGSFVGSGRIVAEKGVTKGVAYRRIVGGPDPLEAYKEAVYDSVCTVPNAPGWRTRGTVTTVFATAPGGAGTIRSNDAVYATARTGGTLSAATNNHVVGQVETSGYFCYESVLIFDTSGIPDTDTVSGVVLSLDGASNSSTIDFNAIAASSAYDGGASATTDWVSGASLAALTTYASWASSGYDAAYNAFTSAGAAFNTAINKTGNTPIMLYSDRHSAGTTPTNSTAEHCTFTDADAAGTTTDPKLDITHAAAAGGVNLRTLMGVGT